MLVYDFGGGTFDASLVRRRGLTYEVLRTEGRPIGGHDIDLKIYEDWKKTARPVFRDQLDDRQGDVRSRNAARNNQIDILRLCRDLKHRLSSIDEASISWTVNTGRVQEPEYYRLDRQKLNNMIQPFIKEALDCCDTLLKKARIAPYDVKRVVLIGGTCRIPAVQDSLARKFGQTRVFPVDEPELAVAMGAAQCADALERAEKFLVEVEELCQSSRFRAKLEDNLPELIELLAQSLAKLLRIHAVVPCLREWRDGSIINLSAMEDQIKDRARGWVSSIEGKAVVLQLCETWLEKQIPKFADLSDPICERYQIQRDILRMPTSISELETQRAAGPSIDEMHLDDGVLSPLLNPIVCTIIFLAATSLSLLGFVTEIIVTIVALIVGFGFREAAVDKLKGWNIPLFIRKIILSYKKIDKMTQEKEPELIQALQKELTPSESFGPASPNSHSSKEDSEWMKRFISFLLQQMMEKYERTPDGKFLFDAKEGIDGSADRDTLMRKFISDLQQALGEVMLGQARERARFIWLHPVDSDL